MEDWWSVTRERDAAETTPTKDEEEEVVADFGFGVTPDAIVSLCLLVAFVWCILPERTLCRGDASLARLRCRFRWSI